MKTILLMALCVVGGAVFKDYLMDLLQGVIGIVKSVVDWIEQ